MPYLNVGVSLEGKEEGWKQLKKLNIERERMLVCFPSKKEMDGETNSNTETQYAYFPCFTSTYRLGTAPSIL